MGLNEKLLFHHHATVYVDPDTGRMYTYSFIGRWINEIARHCTSVGLLLHEVGTRSARHDTWLNEPNIEFISLGAPGNYTDRFQKIRRIKSACKAAATRYDRLLIRGITPRQMTIFKHTQVKQKSYLLVGSIADSKPAFVFSIVGIIQYLLYFLRIWELKKMSKSCRFFANSPAITQEIADRFGVPATYIPTNTLMDTEVRPVAEKKLHDPIRLIFCGRLVPDKGIFELVEAVYLLQNMGHNCNLVFVGEKNSVFGEQLAALPYWSRIADRISFTGFVTFGPELFQHYEAADFYVLPSYHEGFPHSIWEAASVSTPVLTTPVGGIPGILSDKDVYWIKPRDPQSIATVVQMALEDDRKRFEKVQSLHNLLLKNTLEKGVARLIDEIRSINTQKSE